MLHLKFLPEAPKVVEPALNIYQLNREAEPKQLKSECNANKINIDFHVKINK